MRLCLEMCQIKDMSNQELPVVSLDAGPECCAPLACEPLPAEVAEDLGDKVAVVQFHFLFQSTEPTST